MKKIFIAIVFLFTSIAVQAQLDVGGLTGQIMQKLKTALNLNMDQTPQVGDAVVQFLTKKVDILPLQKTDVAEYASKFNLFNGAFISKLKTILLARQMTSFLGLKPKINTADNVMSHLFY